MMFSSSGSTGAPRVFRYSQVDRETWAWANARALLAMGFRQGDTVFMITGFGPHVWAWGVEDALAKMQLPMIPGGGMDAKARAEHHPALQADGPAVHAVLRAASRPRSCRAWATIRRRPACARCSSAASRRWRSTRPGGASRALWNARIVEFYGCTEASPHVGGYSCPAQPRGQRRRRRPT